jgi:catechol 2,3-dioxygenase-like lactoylglutathione lyase family enzyme
MAIMCDNPDEMQEWYQRWFGFEELSRTPEGTVYLTDGYFSLGLLKRGTALEDEQKRGLHHFGFQIKSIGDIERNLEDFAPAIRIEERPNEDPYAQYRIRDPEGVILDLSEDGFGAPGEQRIPGIRHLAMFNRNPHGKFAFYQQVLGMRDATRSDAEVHQQYAMTTGRTTSEAPLTTSPFCGDGFVNVAMLGRNMTEEQGAGKWGFNHFGILVRDPLDLVRRMGQVDPADRPADVRPPERQVEYGVLDPEGNRIDVSGKKGWKVDVDRWARVED